MGQPLTRSGEAPPRVLPLGRCADLLDLHALDPARYPFLLESTAPGPALGRHDLLLAFPEERLELGPDGHLHGPCSGTAQGFLDALDAWRASVPVAGPGADPQAALAGAWFVFLAYEFAGLIEKRLRFAPMSRLPLALAVRCGLVLRRDALTGETIAIAAPGHDACLADLERDLRRTIRPRDAAPECGTYAPDVLPDVMEEPPARFLEAVARAKAHIAAGDVYQINLSREWSASCADADGGVALYRRLRRSNPAPFSALVRLGGHTLLSSSPERLVRTRGRRIETRPIAGTRPRSADRRDDAPVRAELLLNAKERAEHVMLIDLERSDLGRVCAAGSVHVEEFMTLESYSHVHHIVSSVCGTLRPEVSTGQAIAAVFPGGTITGCPKVRCMELIRELEGTPRGAYTGALGYLDANGDCDLNILIRTVVAEGSRVTFRAGSGIVADSDPLQELEETRAKARGLVLALRP